MLTQLSTVESRLALTVTDYDAILTNAIKAVSDRFDKETNRTLARTTQRRALPKPVNCVSIYSWQPENPQPPPGPGD